MFDEGPGTHLSGPLHGKQAAGTALNTRVRYKLGGQGPGGGSLSYQVVEFNAG